MQRTLLAVARGDAPSFDEAYDRYLPRIYAFVARRVEDRAVAEEVTAATFERVLGAMRRDESLDDGIGATLYRVAASAVVDHARRTRKAIPPGIRASDLEVAGDRDVAESIVDELATRAFGTAIDRATVRRALVRLPELQRRVLLLRYLDGLDVEELCAVLGRSRGALVVDLHRALRALRLAIDHGMTIDAA